jgi:hypothetical protein
MRAVRVEVVCVWLPRVTSRVQKRAGQACGGEKQRAVQCRWQSSTIISAHHISTAAVPVASTGSAGRRSAHSASSSTDAHTHPRALFELTHSDPCIFTHAPPLCGSCALSPSLF